MRVERHRRYIVGCILCCLTVAPVAYSVQFETQQPKYHNPIDDLYHEVVGKSYWIMPYQPESPGHTSMRFADDNTRDSFDKALPVAGLEHFRVEAFVPYDPSGQYENAYQVRFDDGTVKWTSATSFTFGLYRKSYIPGEVKDSELFEQDPRLIDANLKARRTAERKRLDDGKRAYAAKPGASLGMTKEEVLATKWGRPQSINKMSNSAGTTEQWVYGGGNNLFSQW